MDERTATNQRRWDDMAELHVGTYGVDAADTAMQYSLRPFEVEELGALTGKRVCHLQCHIGDDSFALIRLGATEVVGVDFSERSVEIATRRAHRTGLHDQVRFVQATVEAAVEAVGTGFDVVYTSWGVLCWLPDLTSWAGTVDALLQPSGYLYLAETHPYASALRDPGSPYGGGQATFSSGEGDYTDDAAVFAHPDQWEWSHGLGETLTALAAAGLHLDWVHEHPTAAWHLNDRAHLVQRDDGMWEVPGSDRPLSFSLQATKPAAR